MLMILALSLRPDLAEAARREVARQECRLKDEGEQITVCGRREERKRYQVTDPAVPYDPGGNVKGVMTERMGWIAEGDSGIGSCSNIGPSAGTTASRRRGDVRCSKRAGWSGKQIARQGPLHGDWS